MKNLIKTVSFLAVISMFSGAFAATSRVGMVSQAASRRLSISGKINPVVLTTASGTTSSATSLLTDAECKDDYRNCLRASDVCGDQFEECPNRMLFHVQMPKCEHVLYKCSSLGLYQLFGTSNIAELGTPIFGGGTGTEIVDYKYPTMNWVESKDSQGNVIKTATSEGSQVGQWIAAGYGDNAYSLAECKRKYERCLRKDDVCGEDFELCTNNKDFMAQAMLCESHLVRCSEAGRDAFYGHETNHSYDGKKIQSGSLIAQWIDKGKGLAAYNAVNTCYKVADNCLLDACNKNPVKCMNGQPLAAALMVDDLNSVYLTANAENTDANGTMEGSLAKEAVAGLAEKVESAKSKLKDGETGYGNTDEYVITAKYVSRYLRNMCREKIGSNRYCYMTAFGKEPKKATDLVDIDNIDDVYGTIYADRYNSSMREKLESILNKYDSKMYGKCADTIKTCVMRACGGGVGSLCYASVYSKGGQNSVNGANTYKEISELCGPIVNTDPYCQYAVEKKGVSGEAGDYFSALFPKYSGDTDDYEYGKYSDPLGVIASLNASLSSSFSPAAISMLREQCTRTAQNCVKAMCGKDYEKCYRNRTDIMLATYDTEDDDFNDSMNRMGGILDYTIVTGLCVNTIKASKACDEHFKISQIAVKENMEKLRQETEGMWGINEENGEGSVRNDWMGAAGYLSKTNTNGTFKTSLYNKGYDDGWYELDKDGRLIVGYAVSSDNAKVDKEHDCYAGKVSNEEGLGEDGCNYTEVKTQSLDAYLTEQGAKTLFQDILQDLEREAQAKYKAQLTKRANMCRKQTVDGLSYAAGDGGATYEWVKTKAAGKFNSSSGFKAGQLIRSNDVYNSFCRVRVTLVAHDAEIQKYLKDDNVEVDAYFPVGYPITCGSWLTGTVIENIADKIADKEKAKWNLTSTKGGIAMAWSTIGGALLGATGGGLIANYLNQKNLGDGGFVTSLWSNSDQKLTASNKTNAGSCVNNIDSCLKDKGNKNGYCTKALRDARVAKVETKENSNYDQALKNLSAAISAFNPTLWVALQNDCQDKYDENTKYNSRGNVAGGAVLGGAIAAALGAGVTASVFRAKGDTAYDKKYQAFMDSLAEKMSCYVGPAEVTSFGETFAITLDD